MEGGIVTYALCEYKCINSKKCLRYINRASKDKAIVNFKEICGAKHSYQWFYQEPLQIKEKRTNDNGKEKNKFKNN